jgi:hypothetical protein
MLTLLNLNRDVDKLLVLTEEFSISLRRLWLMRYDRNDSCELARANLPNVEIADDRVTVALHCAANFIRQVGGLRRAVEQDAAGVAEQAVSP